MTWNDVSTTNLNGLVFKVLWRSCPGCQAEAAIFRQRLLWCTTYPVSVDHFVHLSGHGYQCDHIWRLTWWCHRKHAGNDPQFFFLRVFKKNVYYYLFGNCILFSFLNILQKLHCLFKNVCQAHTTVPKYNPTCALFYVIVYFYFCFILLNAQLWNGNKNNLN